MADDIQSKRDDQNIKSLMKTGICSKVDVVSDVEQVQLKNQYYQEMELTLPENNGTAFLYFFNEMVLKHKDDFSSFVSSNKWKFYHYFSEYFIGILLIILLIVAISPKCSLLRRRLNSCLSTDKHHSTLIKVRTFLFILMLILASIALWKGITFKYSVENSVCKVLKIN